MHMKLKLLDHAAKAFTLLNYELRYFRNDQIKRYEHAIICTLHVSFLIGSVLYFRYTFEGTCK